MKNAISAKKNSKNNNGKVFYSLGLRYLKKYTEKEDLHEVYSAYGWLTLALLFNAEKADDIQFLRNIIDEKIINYPNHYIAYATTLALAEFNVSAYQDRILELLPKRNWMYELWEWQAAQNIQPFPLTKEDMILETSINMERGSLTKLPEGLFFMGLLKNLNLNNNTLNELPDTIGRLDMLTRLSCSFNYLTNLPSKIIKLTYLVDLELAYNMLEHIPDEVFELKNLTNLTLFGNPINRISGNIKNLINLESLDLRETNIPDLPQDIAMLKNLRSLLLSSKFIHKDKRKNIASLLPNCQITYDQPWMSTDDSTEEIRDLIQSLVDNGQKIPAKLQRYLIESENNQEDEKLFKEKLLTYPIYKLFN